MPSTNLDFNIIAKTGQALGEIRLLKAEIQDLGRSLRAAVKAGDTAGAQTISQNIGRMEAQLRGLNRTLGQTEVAGVQAARGLSLTARSFRSLEGGVQGLVKSFGGARAGLVALGVTVFAKGIIDQLSEVEKRLTDLRDKAREIGVKPIVLQAAQEVARETGQSAEDATKAMEGLGEAIRKARVEAASGQPIGQATRGPFANAPLVMRGSAGDAAPQPSQTIATAQGVVSVLRGGQPIVLNYAKALEMVGAQTERFTADQKGMAEQQQAALRGFLAIQKQLSPQLFDELSRTLFKGVPADSMIKIAPAELDKLQAKIAELQTSARGATDGAMSDLEKLTAARGQVLTQWYETEAKFFAMIQPLELAATQSLANWIKPAAEVLFPALKTALDFVSDAINRQVAAWKALSDTVSSLAQPIMDAARSVGSGIQAAWDAVKSAASTATPQMSFATGGMVRGPGGPTSDSILARLSNGEFVMSAGAVQRWGAGLLASMNGGGTLIPRNGKYAAGGLVAAGGGAPVHLHLGGSSFALSGSQTVVNALVVEAHRHKIRSAGIKPSWYGGSPAR
jgi:hypothetical protein